MSARKLTDIENWTRIRIVQVLNECHGRIMPSAKKLGLNRKTLTNTMKRFRINQEDVPALAHCPAQSKKIIRLNTIAA